MSRFSATNVSQAVVAAPRADIWAAITDATLLPRLTPLLRRIDTDGDLWRWHLSGLSVLGVGISPVFTERMTFTEAKRIEYTHEPPAGTSERTGAEGWYDLTDSAGGTDLAISLTLHVDLPISGLARPAVTLVMHQTMQQMGERFSTNLQRYLGVPAR